MNGNIILLVMAAFTLSMVSVASADSVDPTLVCTKINKGIGANKLDRLYGTDCELYGTGANSDKCMKRDNDIDARVSYNKLASGEIKYLLDVRGICEYKGNGCDKKHSTQGHARYYDDDGKSHDALFAPFPWIRGPYMWADTSDPGYPSAATTNKRKQGVNGFEDNVRAIMAELGENDLSTVTIETTCRSGVRSAYAANILVGMGFTPANVYQMYGGMEGGSPRQQVTGWVCEGLPTTKGWGGDSLQSTVKWQKADAHNDFSAQQDCSGTVIGSSDGGPGCKPGSWDFP